MITNIGTHTLTGEELIRIQRASSNSEGHSSSIKSNDSVSIGAKATDYWNSQADQISSIASANGKSVEGLLNESITWNNQGWRSVADFFGDTPITPDTTQVTYTERNSIVTSKGLKIDASIERGAEETILKSVISITRTDGSQISFDATGDVRIQEKENGTLLVTDLDTGKSCKFMVDGTIDHLEDDSSLFNYDEDTTYIKLTQGSTINTGNGDDSVLIISGGGNVNTSAGNDNIVIGSFARGKTNIDAGKGNDSINAGKINKDIHINLGEGDDFLSAKLVDKGATIDMESGNDDVRVLKNIGTIILGQGNNRYFENDTGRSYDKSGKVIAGDGDNQITSRMANNITLGDGNNTIIAQFINDMNIGDGSNKVISEYLNSIIIGDGNNNVESVNIINAILGNGNNKISAINLNNSGQLNVGNGKNVIDIKNAYDATINLGDGNNSIQINDTHSSNLNTGNGNNSITINSLRHNSSLNSGDGANSIIINESKYGASITLGDGNNSLGMNNIYGHETTINIGDGDNILSLMWHSMKKYGDTAPPSVTIGNGNNQIFMEQNFPIALGSGNNIIKSYVRNSYSSNSIQVWIDDTLSKMV